MAFLEHFTYLNLTISNLVLLNWIPHYLKLKSFFLGHAFSVIPLANSNLCHLKLFSVSSISCTSTFNWQIETEPLFFSWRYFLCHYFSVNWKRVAVLIYQNRSGQTCWKLLQATFRIEITWFTCVWVIPNCLLVPMIG